MSHDPQQIIEAQRRERVLRVARQMMEHNQLSQKQVAARLGISTAGLSRDLRAYTDDGLEGLIRGTSTGRPAAFILSKDETQALRLFRLEKGSLHLAIQELARSEFCLPHTREAIRAILDAAAVRRRRPDWPVSLRKAGYVTEEQHALFRGRKRFQAIEHLDRRGMFWEEEGTGQQHLLIPNSLWESDDVSANEPFSWRDPGSRELRVGRQTLATQDVFSLSFLGGSPLGRQRDAYRVEDIAEHMLECVLACGLPDFWRLERGAWENNFIDGVPVVGGERWGGLDALFTVIRTWKSRGKGGIESSFNHLQNLMAHQSTSIGRVRGEFEAGTKKFLRAGAGDERAVREFWSISQYADALRAAMLRFNGEGKQRHAFGRDLVVPADLYATAQRRELPDSERWRFCPVKKVATIRGGHIEASVEHYPLPFRFRVNGYEDTPYLENGYPVLIAFHAGHPERGCHVFNGERGSRNRDNWKFGQLLVVAEPAADAPQFSMSRDEQRLLARKKANASLVSEFRAIKGHDNRPAARVSLARDGFGGSARVDNASPADAASEAAAPASRKRGDDIDQLALKVAEKRRAAKDALGIL